MAAGVPATGMGGIFYLLLSAIMLLYEIMKKVVYALKKGLKIKEKPAMLTKIPTLAFVVCGILLIYMNLTGFRFVIPGTQETSVSMGNLWILGAFSVSLFMVIMVLFHLRARRLTVKTDKSSGK
jgi:hypothetical protein